MVYVLIADYLVMISSDIVPIPLNRRIHPVTTNITYSCNCILIGIIKKVSMA
jgi:hypothetical protein